MLPEQVRTFEQIPLIELPRDYPTQLGTFLARMYETHGPIFRSIHFGEDVVFLVGPEANRFVLSTERLRFSHHEGWRVVVNLFGDGLLTMDGDEHAEHRQMMSPAFTMSHMEHYVKLM